MFTCFRSQVFLDLSKFVDLLGRFSSVKTVLFFSAPVTEKTLGVAVKGLQRSATAF